MHPVACKVAEDLDPSPAAKDLEASVVCSQKLKEIEAGHLSTTSGIPLGLSHGPSTLGEQADDRGKGGQSPAASDRAAAPRQVAMADASPQSARRVSPTRGPRLSLMGREYHGGFSPAT